ncbi:MAG: ThiF family adenylyltransferase, partial [Candidatus Rokubacteria bacterium]|nr:ThiF family adenylyltransferase [Candidatus Rokubacteria bacterium]
MSPARDRPAFGAAFDYAEAFSRNLGLVTGEEQARLRRALVAIAGLGGVGGAYVLALVRLGIGGFALADFDRFELANMNRQAGATIETLGRPKVEVMAEMAAAINPAVDLRLFPAGLAGDNVAAFLDGAVAAIDGIDFFNMAARRLLFRAARGRGVHALTAAPVGFGATLHVFAPDGMAFDEYFDFREGMGLGEQLLNFALGLAPKRAHKSYFPSSAVDVSARRAPSLAPGCFLTAGIVASEVANLVLRRRPVR